MKLKMIVVGISLVTMSHLVAECNKNEVMKMIDRGFSKQEIDSICGSNKVRLITPSDSKCVSYGGKIYKGVCEADWNTAKSICAGSGGRLATIDELKKVVVDCGGIINDYKKNKKNSSYQSCLKSKGFSDYNVCWSSTTKASHTSYAWAVYFDGGDDTYTDKNTKYVIRCVKSR